MPLSRKSFLTAEDLQRLVNAAQGARNRLIVGLLVNTGIRVSELLAIKVGDIDFQNRAIIIPHLKSAGRRNRLIKVDRAILVPVWNYIRDMGLQVGDHIFSITRQMVYVIVREAAQAAGLGGKALSHPIWSHSHYVSPHRLRDAFGTNTCLKAENMEKVATIQEMMGHAKVASVAEYTPVVIRKDDLVQVLDMVTLWQMGREETVQDGVEVRRLEEVYLYRKAWTPIKAIFRHKYEGNLIRVVAQGALLDVTPNHSIFLKARHQLRLVDAKEVKLGNILALEPFAYSFKWGLKGDAAMELPFRGTLELAWAMGLFAAEGYAPAGRKWPAHSINIVNTKTQLLERAKAALEDNFHVRVGLHLNKRLNGTPSNLSYVETYDRRLTHYFRRLFYSAQGDKLVPAEIQNAPAEVRQAFLDGYISGDGHRRKANFSFTSKSHALLQGIALIVTGLGIGKLTVITQGGTERQATINVVQRADHEAGMVKVVHEVPYCGYVYDLETADHRFPCGVGSIIAHNTTLRYFKLSGENLERVYDELTRDFRVTVSI